MDFFAAQDQARRNTRRLLWLFGAAVLVLILLTNLALVGALWLFDERIFAAWGHVVEAPSLDGAQPPRGLPGYIDVPLLLGVGVVVSAVVAFASLWKSVQLARGGSVVAELLGGVLLAPDAGEPLRRRLLNVVEEMAIASGLPVPPVYLLPEEGINAFAAGFSADDAVIGITEGALQQLDRDELQGVLAHEFSHILNGDMRLNMRLISLLHGILFIAQAGRVLLRGGTRRSVVAVRGRRDGSGSLVVLGIALLAIGSAGVLLGRMIRAAVSRQREFLADASAVQFTRLPEGLASALRRIGGYGAQGVLRAERAEEASHLLFAQGIAAPAWFATHPPLAERIRRIDPRWDGRFTPARAQPAGADTPEPATMPVAAIIGAAALVSVPVTEQLRAACRDGASAPAVVLCCLLEERGAVRTAQLGIIAQRDAGLAERVEHLAACGASRNGDALVLLELCMPALKSLPERERMAFWQLLLGLVELDGHIDLREMLVAAYLQRHLVATPGELREPRARYARLAQVEGAASLLCSGLALATHAGEPAARAALRAAADAAQLPGLRMVDAGAINWNAIYAALWKLRAVYPLLKPRLIKGCRAALGVPEAARRGDAAALLDLVAAVLDCPAGEPGA